MRVLGIETSCDETAVAVWDDGCGLRAHALHSQADLHALHGGVVPELASRDHVQRLAPLVADVLRRGGLTTADIDGVAYTTGPGLAGALLVGAAFAEALALGLEVPALGVHHMEGHLLAPLMETPAPAFPFVALLVSGGHTLLADVEEVGRYVLLGESLDDAAGEAFDKTAKLLGLGYPGGPRIERLARDGQPGRFRFPRPMLDRPGLDFSFSGLKTAASLALAQVGDSAAGRADLAAEFQAAVIETLAGKAARALSVTGRRRLVVAGGVSANAALRAHFARHVARDGIEVHYPRLEFCTDNGAMIAFAGARRLAAGERSGGAFAARPRWSLAELRPPGAQAS